MNMGFGGSLNGDGVLVEVWMDMRFDMDKAQHIIFQE